MDRAARDHLNTGHPRTHIVVRGTDDRGADLVVAREYMTTGIRERVAELVDLDLGPRTQRDITQTLRAEVEQERLTTIDRALLRDADAGRVVAAHARDAFDQTLRAEAAGLRDRPVAITMLPAQPLDKLIDADAATWIRPRADIGGSRTHPRRRVRPRSARCPGASAAVAGGAGFCRGTGGNATFSTGMIATLQRRELLRVAGQLTDEVNMPFREAAESTRIEGVYRRSIDLVSGRFAMIERARDFTLVPWRPVLERQVGKSVSGLMRGDGISWSIGHGRSGPSIS